jgi:sulfite reductase beta subunit-like hemoprotein
VSRFLGNSRDIKVALKYCGCCNPQVDLTRIARHLADLAKARGDFRIVPLSQDDVEVVVILCGCPRACGNKEEFKARARRSVVVTGESLAGRSVPEADLPSAAAQEVANIFDT